MLIFYWKALGEEGRGRAAPAGLVDGRRRPAGAAAATPARLQRRRLHVDVDGDVVRLQLHHHQEDAAHHPRSHSGRGRNAHLPSARIRRLLNHAPLPWPTKKNRNLFFFIDAHIRRFI